MDIQKKKYLHANLKPKIDHAWVVKDSHRPIEYGDIAWFAAHSEGQDTG